MLVNNVLELLGNTPLLKCNKLNKVLNLKGELYLKIESYNPAGSIKDRVAYQMIKDLEKNNILKPNSTIIEPTSGNTGIGLALVGAVLGYKVIIIMPNSMSEERIKLIKAYGAKVILTDGALGMKGCIDKANELKSMIDDSVIASQFDNPSNPYAHYLTTGREILSDLPLVDCVVSSIGTGGTITGIAKCIKEVKECHIVGVEPTESPLITKGYANPHKIQGIGANFIPSILDLSLIDEVKTIDIEESLKYARLLMKEEGVNCGISSGCALACAIKLLQTDEYKSKKVVVILPDGVDRYLSTNLIELD